MELLALQQKSASQEPARGSCGDHSDVTERRATETLKAEEERRHSTENWSRNASTGDAAADGDVIAGSYSDTLRAEEHEDTRAAASHLLTSVKAELTTSGTEELEGACAVGDVRSGDVDADVTSSSADDSSDSFIIDVIAGANQPAGACDEVEDDVTSETFNEDDLAISAIACSNAPASVTHAFDASACAISTDDDFVIDAIASSNAPATYRVPSFCECETEDGVIALNFHEQLLLTESSSCENVSRLMSAVDPVAAMHEKWARMLGVTSSTSASDVQVALECAECDEVVCLAGSCSSSSVCLEATYDATRNLPTTEASVVCAEPLLSTLLTSDLSSSEQDAVTSASEPSQSQTTSTNDRDAEQEIKPCKFPASRSHTTSHIVTSDSESQHERSERREGVDVFELPHGGTHNRARLFPLL